MTTTVDFNSIPSGMDLSPLRIDQMHRSATELAQAFARRLERIMETFNEARERYSREAQELIDGAGDPDSKRAAQQLAKARLAKQLVNFRRTLVASSDDERQDMLRQLNALAEEAKQIEALHASPIQFLSRMGLGDSRRLYIQQTLEQAGPIEMETAARLAIMSKDVLMAAAIVTVVDRRPRDRRPINPADFAARVVGIEHADIHRKLTGVKVAFQSAFAAEREFVSGKVDPLMSVSVALARRGLAEPAQQAKEA